MVLSRRQFLALAVGGVGIGVLGIRLLKSSFFGNAEIEQPKPILSPNGASIARVTQDLLGGEEHIVWRGEEVIGLGGVAAYSQDYRGFEYHVDGDIPMVPAGDYRVASGLHFITWMVKDRDGRDHSIISFPVKIL